MGITPQNANGVSAEDTHAAVVSHKETHLMYAYRNTEALPASTPATASILPALDVGNVVHWYEPNGTTRTGQIESVERIDGIWWAAARYELIANNWVLTNQHAHNFFLGVGVEFPLQLGQSVWFKSGNVWQAATIADFYLESGEWFASLEYELWYSIIPDEKPLCEIRTTQPELAEDVEYAEFVSKADFWANNQYEDRRDSR
jgi:hypothetical protein